MEVAFDDEVVTEGEIKEAAKQAGFTLIAPGSAKGSVSNTGREEALTWSWVHAICCGAIGLAVVLLVAAARR